MVERRINTHFNSYNGFSRKAPVRGPYGNGRYIDYILVYEMRVVEWETVVDNDDQGKLRGIIPSDHTMITAKVERP
ncbi:hypothetical protein IWX62_003215 [Arthrobacter sp. CAN_A1]